MDRGSYEDRLDPERYYTVARPRRVRRQRINNNLWEDSRFCPIVRRTDVLQGFEKANLTERCRKTVSSYPLELLKRAMSYLHTRKTRSSFEIEHIKPNSTRTERFVSLLRLAETGDFCEKTRLIDLRNRIVDPRFRASDYRTSQNYIGETVAWQREKVHFACPKIVDMPDRQIDLFIRFCLQNDGRLSARKRSSHFDFLSDEEVALMEQTIRSSYGN